MSKSIKDIARAAGVSHSTVSRALSNSPLVNADTRTHILRLAREMGYSPDDRARSLVRGRSYTLGVVMTFVADPFQAEVVDGIERTARADDYSVILASSHAQPDREIATVEMLRSKRVDAVIVASSRLGALYQDLLERTGLPVILVNSHGPQVGSRYAHSVTVDNRHGGYQATRHLVELGHRRIAYVLGAEGSASEERMQGYRDALAEAGVVPDPRWLVHGTGRAQGGERALDALLRLPMPPSAVFCYNDMTAIGVLQAARREGLGIPDDLAVVGFDDIPFAAYVCPALTTVAQPKVEMGQQAVQMALALLAGEEVTDRVLQGQLVVRESSVDGAVPISKG